jgi:acetyl esterase/lipase
MTQSPVTTHTDIVFAEHDGTQLLGDLYLPQGVAKAPVLIGVHGGGWQLGNRKFYNNMGAYLAGNGIAVFAIEYRLMAPRVKTYPGAVYDVRAAVQFVRAQAGELGLDPERIGLIGDSAGAHLSALVALAGSEAAFSTSYKSDPYADISPKVKAVVGFYGVYDLLAQWQHDVPVRPRDNISEKFLGAAPHTDRKVFFEASRSATRPWTRTARAFCWSTAPRTMLLMRRHSRPRFSPHSNRRASSCARSSFPAPDTTSSPIRWTTPASTPSPLRACCGF